MLSTSSVFLLSSCPSPLCSYALECELGDSEKCKCVFRDILLATTHFSRLQLFPKSSSGLTVGKSSDFKLKCWILVLRKASVCIPWHHCSLLSGYSQSTQPHFRSFPPPEVHQKAFCPL